MKLTSARQAWHDALYENRDSVLAVAAEKAKLGKRGVWPTRRTRTARTPTGAPPTCWPPAW